MRFHRKIHLQTKKKEKNPALFYSLRRGRWIKRDANTANWINLPPLNRCDAWGWTLKRIEGKNCGFNDVVFVCACLCSLDEGSTRWGVKRKKKISHNEAVWRRGAWCHMVSHPPPGVKWQAAHEHRDRIKRWAKRIKLISGHAENGGPHNSTDDSSHMCLYILKCMCAKTCSTVKKKKNWKNNCKTP